MALGDSTTGTPVTLVVTPGQTTPAPPPQEHPLPFTGFELAPVLALAAALLAAGSVLATIGRRVPARVRARRSPSPRR